MTDQNPTLRLTDQLLDEIDACVNGPLGTATTFDHEAVAPLVAEVRRFRAYLSAATEFRLQPAPPAYTPMIVRRDPAYDPTGWTVLHDPGDSSVRRIWTAEGWEMAWASTHAEIYCWADAASALAQARRAQAEEEPAEPDVDGAGRTRESYRDRKVQPAAVRGPDNYSEIAMRGWTA
ncbi:hypothetical protein [Streptomyces sp. NPDC047990]|uniref:hypothetical protein n=1 Tax=Streptomyces sp. NPDC047990 TaxID=3365496 RepID=UPI0037179A27